MDCIEFNAEFRRLDVADELCFLAMECDILSFHEAGATVRRRCLELLADQPPQELTAFYLSYRATVRAKVASLRAQQQTGAEQAASLALVQRYLELADGYQRPSRRLVVVRGLAGTGKSTLAAGLAQRLGWRLLQTDALRQELQGASNEVPQELRYTQQQRDEVYQEMFRQAERLLGAGLSTVLDGTFLKHSLREQAAAVARRSGAGFTILDCRCPPDIARIRIASRLERQEGLSEAQPELIDRQQAEEEPLAPGPSVLAIDTTQPPPVQLQQALAFIACDA